ncbi:MAG: nuclear transport factor 2 family protein [Cyclobacteriaceae bacterium]|nr:nuclear transport factor 2 family protein [Cyclobacteriaceae bacterium]MDH4295966.1 nuclear transport factor 2 family protein [Cyclobacteriaceae bacterium]MDH5250125.1 nuclear transport factor 2 family protein [Cyclobacteriaceae bacterium]
MRISYTILLLLSAVLTGCNVKTNITTTDHEEKTKEVLDHHWKAFQANDLEETMADYTEESILITPDRTFKGLDQIRKNFVDAFVAFPTDSATLQLNKSIVSENVGYIIWQASTPSFILTFATDTFIIHNGKIVRQTYAGIAEPL